MAKKIKADALASEVMKELDDYSSLTTEVMKKAVRNAGKKVREEIAAVSYTHLDVYKRQVLRW